MDDHKRVWHNLGYMYLLQGVNYAVPLITIPYLIRTLGLKQFGLISFAYAFVNYFVVIANFGFQLSGTEKVSVNRSNNKYLSELCSAIYLIKIGLAAISFAVFFIVIRTCPVFSSYTSLYLISFLAVIGNVLFPNWFFLGLEKMQYITILNLGAKSLCLLGIVYFVKSKSDILSAVFFQSSVEILSGIAALFILRYSFGIKLRLPSIMLIKRICRDSREIFLSQLAATLITSSNTFILGLFASKESVGIFAAADKVVRLVIALTVPVNNAVYPRVSQMFKESQEKSMIFLRRIFIPGTMFFASASIALCLGASQIVRLATGANDSDITLLVKLMAAIPLFIFVYNFYGNHILLNLSMRGEFAKALFIAGIFSVLSSLAFVPVFQEKATASIFLFSELLVMIFMLRTAHRKGFNLFKPNERKLKNFPISGVNLMFDFDNATEQRRKVT